MTAGVSFWLAVAGMLVLVAVALLLPVLRRPGRALARAEYDLAIYRDQLRELEEDEKNGLITAQEAEAARNEIARRILAADEARRRARDAMAAATGRERLVGILAAVVLVPAMAVAIYLQRGQPGMPDFPIAERLRHAAENNDIAVMVRKVEERLAARPDDLEGWKVIAPVYVRLGQIDKAITAYRNAIRLSKPDADLYNGLGEALVIKAEGRLTPEARRAFEKALKLAPGNPMSRYYLAQAALQDGRKEEALRELRKLLDDLPADFGGRHVIEQQIARLEEQAGKAAAAARSAPEAEQRSPAQSNPAQSSGGPSAEAVRERMKAMADMSPEERRQMIRNMVEGLEARLKENPQDLGGWLRLIRAWSVLGEKERARKALAEARRALAGKAGAERRLKELARRLAL
jgi:cytochrome c-type biogenesis protein CcmH